MKPLLFTVALFTVASSCTVVKAGYYSESNVTGKKSSVALTPTPHGEGDGYVWDVYNPYLNPVYLGMNNYVGFSANVRNGQGDTDPIIAEDKTRTGAVQSKTFTWVRESATEVRSTTTNLRHSVYYVGHLAAICPTPTVSGSPYARANVTFFADPGFQQLPDGGRNVLLAQNGSVVNVLGNGNTTPGQTPRNFSSRPTFLKTLTNVPATSTQSVEVRIEGKVVANGIMIPAGSFATAESSGNIESEVFYMY